MTDIDMLLKVLNTLTRGMIVLETQIQKLTADATLLDEADRLSQNKLLLLQAYTTQSLVHVYSKLTSTGTDELDISQELLQIKTQIEKLSALESAPASEPQRAAIDVQAAKRFITHALNGNSPSSPEVSATTSRREAESAAIELLNQSLLP